MLPPFAGGEWRATRVPSDLKCVGVLRACSRRERESLSITKMAGPSGRPDGDPTRKVHPCSKNPSVGFGVA
jgi:hypothetical protein